MATKPSFYITTAISYPNGAPHIGHAYEVDRDRRDRALQAARRLGRVLPHRHRRARPSRCSRPPRKEGITPRELVDRNVPRFRAMVEAAELLERRFHPHHRGAPLPLVAGDLGADGGERRHLSRRNMPAGTRCATRPITTRSETERRRRRRALRAAGHAGRMGRGGELFLPALGLSGQAARALRARSPTSSLPNERLQRGGELRAAAACRTCRSRARPSTGASRCPATPSTSCMCGSTR